MEIKTPLLDAALASRPSDFHRFCRAKNLLALALESNSIYNVEYKFSKEDVTSAIDKALKPVWREWFDRHRDAIHNDPYSKLYAIYDIVGYSTQLNHIKGKLKRLSKYVVDVPDFLPYFDMLIEAYQFAVAFETLKPVVIKGRKPAENPTPVDLTNTGTCAICARTFKMTSSKTMVQHGFTISDGCGHYQGYRAGKCFGVYYKPAELSSEANVALKGALEATLDRKQKHLDALRAGEITELRQETGEYYSHNLNLPKTELVLQGDPRFPRLLEQAIARVSTEIDHLECAVKDQAKIIKNWVRKPLYDERMARA